MQEAKERSIRRRGFRGFRKRVPGRSDRRFRKEAETTEDTASETGEETEETDGRRQKDLPERILMTIKRDSSKKKKDKKDEQIEDLTDRLRRQMAEFEISRKRT